MRAITVSVVLLGWSLGESCAWAQEAPRILVMVPERPSLAARLSGELRALGFDPITLDIAPEDGPDSVRLAERESAVAAIWIANAMTAEIWIADRVSDKTVLRSISSGDEGDLALAATELLRASLLEVVHRPPTPRRESSRPEAALPPPVLRLLQSVAPPRFRLSAEGGIGHHVGGPRTLMVGVAFVSAVTPWLEFGPHIDVSLLGTTSVDAASASVTTTRIGGRAALVSPSEPPWQLVGGLAAHAAFVVGRGRADPPLVGRRDATVTASIQLDAGLRIRARGIGLSLTAFVGMFLPTTKVVIAGVRTTRLGRPLVGASAALFWAF